MNSSLPPWSRSTGRGAILPIHFLASTSAESNPASRSAQNTMSGANGKRGRPVWWGTLTAIVSSSDEKALSATTVRMSSWLAAY